MHKQAYLTLQKLETTYWWHVGMRRIASKLLKLLDFPSSTLVLDAGCGTGGNWQMLSKFGQVISLDISIFSLYLARKKIPNCLICADVQRQPFKKESFNLVVSFDVLYHKWVKDLSDVLKGHFRILKLGGWLLLRLPAYQWLYRQHDREVMTARRFTIGQVKEFLPKEAKIVRATYANMFLLPLIVWRKFVKAGDSELKPLPKFLNSVFSVFLFLESELIKFIDLPVGSSIFILLEKPVKTGKEKMIKKEKRSKSLQHIWSVS